MGLRPHSGHKHRRHRLSGHKKSTIDSVRNDINVTPLVDVMLVLLIIFMLMTLLMGRGKDDVVLPKADYLSSEKDKSQPVISVSCEHPPLCDDVELYVEKTKLGPVGPQTLKEMKEQVEAAWAAPKNPEGVGRVYLKADERLPYGAIFPVIEFLNKSMNMSNVDLAVVSPPKKGG